MSTPTPHLEARHGEIAEAVLLPGDPLRAQVIAERFLTDVHCYNRVRNMLGFTGHYRGVRVSVQGTGMGMPSISIYVTELLRFYGVRTAIRVGSCGALRPSVNLRDLVIAIGAHTTSAMNRRRFGDLDFAATGDFTLIEAAHRLARERRLPAHVGTVCTDDAFYDEAPETFERLAAAGTLAVEMEAAALYTIAAIENARALCIATVSDHLVTHEAATSEERQNGFMTMVELALDTIVATADRNPGA
jgi:purine-nucleoside phosphorylase